MHFWQERTWTCGPAALRTALYSIGIQKSERHLAKILNTKIITGTKNKNFTKAIKKYNLNYIVRSNSSIEELKELKKEGYKIIVNYYSAPNKSGHFAVVNNISKSAITLSDPSLGPKLKYKIPYFKKIWHSHDKKIKRWLIAIKK